MPLAPPPTISPGLCLITQQLKRSDMSRAAEVTFAFLDASVTTPANALAAVNKFQAQYNVQFGPLHDSEVTILQPTIRMGDGTTIPTEAVATGATINGADVDTFPPPQVAILAKKLTSFGGRHNRGRTYFPFMVASSDVSENGTVNPVAVAAINTRLAAFLANMADAVIGGVALPMHIANKVFDTPLPPHHVTEINPGSEVSAFVCESLVATQRRRLGR